MKTGRAKLYKKSTVRSLVKISVRNQFCDNAKAPRTETAGALFECCPKISVSGQLHVCVQPMSNLRVQNTGLNFFFFVGRFPITPHESDKGAGNHNRRIDAGNHTHH